MTSHYYSMHQCLVIFQSIQFQPMNCTNFSLTMYRCLVIIFSMHPMYCTNFSPLKCLGAHAHPLSTEHFSNLMMLSKFFRVALVLFGEKLCMWFEAEREQLAVPNDTNNAWMSFKIHLIPYKLEKVRYPTSQVQVNPNKSNCKHQIFLHLQWIL